MSKQIKNMMKQAQKMQAQVLKAQEEMKSLQVEGTAGGGMVKVMMSGSNELVSIKINPEVVDSKDVEMLEDLIIAAHTNALEKIKETSESAFGSITGGLNIPGL
jgi:DNA-binding YbaB/EbfC family protein